MKRRSTGKLQKMTNMENLQFYDMKERKSFASNSYRINTKIVKGRKRKFAVARSPYTGIDCWRVI